MLSNINSLDTYIDNMYANHKHPDFTDFNTPTYFSLLQNINTTKQINVASILSDNINYINGLSVIKQSIAGVSSTINAAKYLKESLILSIEYLENGNTISAADKIRTKELADMCSYNYPKSVFQSRALYGMVSSEPEVYDEDCDPTTPRELLSSNDKNEFTVYPNPATEEINISISSNLIDNLQMNIINIHGQTLKRIEIKESITKLNIGDLPSGVYSIVPSNDELEVRKIIKIK